jgi:hypothetical protein
MTIISKAKRWWLRLHEKGGKHHELPVHHKAEEYLDAYLKAASIADQKGAPVWRSMIKERGGGGGRMGFPGCFPHGQAPLQTDGARRRC